MKVNGIKRDLKGSQRLLDFLQENNYDIRFIAVERNGEIVPQASYEQVLLTEEDSLEIVNFVGGG